MPCKCCWAVMKWEVTSYAKSHLKSSKRNRAKQQAANFMKQSGVSAAILAHLEKKIPKVEEWPDVATPAEPAATTINVQEADLNGSFDILTKKENISDDWVASFLRSGIPTSKLGHPSIRSWLSKYSTKSWMVSMCEVHLSKQFGVRT